MLPGVCRNRSRNSKWEKLVAITLARVKGEKEREGRRKADRKKKIETHKSRRKRKKGGKGTEKESDRDGE